MILDHLFYQYTSENLRLKPLFNHRMEAMTFPEEIERGIFLNPEQENIKKLQEEVYDHPSKQAMLKREGEDFLGKHFGKKNRSTESRENYQIKTGHIQLTDRPITQILQSGLNSIFDTECQPLGDFIYPPGGFRTWHTNKFDVPNDQTSVWAIFFVFAEKSDASFFRFIDPNSGEMITSWDKVACANVFRISRTPLIWHCIKAEDTTRWSIGFHLPDHWQEILDTP